MKRSNQSEVYKLQARPHLIRDMIIFFGTVTILAFIVLFLHGCSTMPVKPGCEGTIQTDSTKILALNAGAVGLSEYLLQHPEVRSDAKKAVSSAITVLQSSSVSLSILVSALQKGISSAQVRARLGYVAIIGQGQIAGTLMNECDREYLLDYFKTVEVMIQ